MTRPGGYRRPTTPAPASGPGALSRRTDGGPGQNQGQPIRDMNNADYGEEKAYRAQQQGALMAESGDMPPELPVNREPGGQPAPQRQQRPPMSGLNAPSERPSEPVTAGANRGPGPGPRQGVTTEPGQLSDALRPYFAEDETGYIRLIAEDLRELGL